MKNCTEQHKNEVIKKCHKEYELRNKDKRRLYYLKNKKRIIESGKKTYQDNKELILSKRKSYYIDNKFNIISQHKQYINRKYKNDPILNITMRCRSRLYRMLADNGQYKQFKTFDLIGCTPQQLKDYLELKFIDNMSWDNRSEWHIDHIRPCISFDLTKLEEQRKCFHYSNLQPLWAEDNLKKHTKEVNNNGE